jgi:hypothetical protein
MDVADKTLEAVKTLSRTVLGLLFLTGLISVYLIQQSLILFARFELATIVGGEPTDTILKQTNIAGLPFMGGVLAVVLPPVLGILCILSRELVRRYNVTLAELTNLDSVSIQAKVNLDPLALDAALISSAFAIPATLRILGWLPSLAIVLHLVGQVAVFCWPIKDRSGTVFFGQFFMSWFLLYAPFALGAISLGFVWCLTFPNTLRAIRDTRRWTVAAGR